MIRSFLSRDRLVTALRLIGILAVCVAGTIWSLQAYDKRYPIAQWLMWPLLPVWGYTLAFNVTCVAGGAAALRLILGKRRLPPLTWIVLCMAVGLVMFVLGLYTLGFTCALRPTGAVLVPILLLVAGFRLAFPQIREFLTVRGGAQLSRFARGAAFLATAFGVTCVAFVYLGTLDFDAINFDARWYHIPIAQDYARLGCIVPFPGENHRAFPHLTSMVQSWALLVPGVAPLPMRWTLLLHLEFSIVVWRIVGVAALAEYLLYSRRVPGLWSVFFLFPSIFVYDQNIGGSADHFLGFFAAPVVLALARFVRSFAWRPALVLGIVMAGHVLTKYQAVYLLTGATAAVAVRLGYVAFKHVRQKKAPSLQRRARLRRLWSGPALAMAVALALTAPHWLKNWVYYNNPVYPRGLTVFSHSDPMPAKGYYKESKRAPGTGPFAIKHSGWRRQLWATEGIFTYPFETRNRDFTDHKPYMGALFSLLLPCILFIRRAQRLWLGVGVGAVAFLVWMNTSPNDRYLLSFYDLFIAAAAALTVRVWELGWLARLALAPVVLLQLAWGGDAMLAYGGKRVIAAIRRVEQGYQGKSLKDRLKDQGLQQQITAALPADARVLARNYKDLLGLDRMVVSDIRESQYYVSYSHLADAHALWNELHERGITHLLYPDGRRPPVRLNNTVLFGELFHHYARNVKRFSYVALAEMPKQSPPPTAPFLVLCRGMRSYPDGLYRVEQLDVDDRKPKASAPPPKPIEAYSDRQAPALVDSARAAALRNGTRLSAGAQRILDTEFKAAERFSEFTLYLRKPR